MDNGSLLYNRKIGDFFKDSVDKFEFTAKNIFEVKKLVYGKENQLNPASFSKICPSGFIVFLIKDTLEYNFNFREIILFISINFILFISINFLKYF